jgi:hypothetical protein
MKTILIILLFTTDALFGQEYRPYHVVADSLLVKTVVGKKTSYTYATYLFDILGRQLKFKENKKLIYSEEAPEGTRKVTPYVFTSDSTTDHMLLLTELSSETMNGFNLYILNGLETKSIGFFALALSASVSRTNKTSPRSQSLVNYINIETNGTQWRISFNAEDVVIHPGTDREETMKGKDVKFLYNGKKLKEVDKF